MSSGDYADKVILAPMVRVGTLPMRLLAADYGADLTYSEELIDHKLVKCKRVENLALGTVDFVEGQKGEVVFRTSNELEKDRVVLQIGTADAVRALKAAQLVCQDVRGVDVNMGCPQHFSLSGGMGAALLTQPEKIKDILSTLLRNLPVPVTCKIRLLGSRQATVDLAKMIEQTGIAALAVHGRTVAERPRHPAHWEEIRAVADALSIPVIANGDVFDNADFQRVKSITGASSVMVARAAQWNCSVFREQGLHDVAQVKADYMIKCVLADNDLKNTKYVIRQMIEYHDNLEGPEGKAVTKCRSLRDMCALYGVADFHDLVQQERDKGIAHLSMSRGSVKAADFDI